MSVTGIGSIANAYQNTVQNTAAQRRSDFQQLAQALQSGDLSGARQAFAALRQTFGASKPDQAGNQFGNSPGGQSNGPFAALAQALQSGDLSGAQQAFAALRTQMHGAHGHHHHRANLQASATASAGTNGDGDNDSSSINVMA